MAAKRAGIKLVLLPALNRKDLEEIPAAAWAALRFEFLETVDEALNRALETVENGREEDRSPASGDEASAHAGA